MPGLAASSAGQSSSLPERDLQKLSQTSPYYESESDDGIESLSSLSDLSDRELDLQAQTFGGQLNRRPATLSPPKFEDELDEFEKDPWNAVVVIGLRVYHKADEEDKNKEIIRLKVVRPSPYTDSDEENTAAEETKKEEQDSKSKGLDVDDSAKDATLEGGLKDRKKSIVGNGET